jgi:hypothetical protein
MLNTEGTLKISKSQSCPPEVKTTIAQSKGEDEIDEMLWRKGVTSRSQH